MSTKYNKTAFVVDHNQETLDFLEFNKFKERTPAVSSESKNHNLKIMVFFNEKTYFAYCFDNIKMADKLTESIFGSSPKHVSLNKLRICYGESR